MTYEIIFKTFCIISLILITYWKMFGGKPNDNR